MKIFRRFGRVFSVLCAASVLSASATSALPTSQTRGTSSAQRNMHGRSWIAHQASGTTLYYLAEPNLYGLKVFRISGFPYPQLYPIGVLYAPTGGGLCADYIVGGGGKKMTDNHLFVTQPGAGAIAEYLGGSVLPLMSLNDAGQAPVDCAVDPKTGDLAVANSGGSSGNPPSIAMYKRGKGGVWNSTPSQVSSDTTMLQFNYCGFDNAGNLYVTGTDTSNATAERTFNPRSSVFGDLTLNQKLNSPGGVLWDGTHVAILDPGVAPNVVYQFQVSGTNGVETGSTTLRASRSITQFWLYDGVLIGPDPGAYGGSLTMWSYPAGGSPFSSGGPVTSPGGAIVLAE